MISSLEQTRAANQQKEVLGKCAAILHPKFKRLLNPNIVDAKVRLSLHVANGVVNHYRDWESEPAYCTRHAAGWLSDDEAVRETLTLCLAVMRGRIDCRIGHGWHGVVILNVEIAGGSASVSSEVDGVHKTQ